MDEYTLGGHFVAEKKPKDTWRETIKTNSISNQLTHFINKLIKFAHLYHFLATKLKRKTERIRYKSSTKNKIFFKKMIGKHLNNVRFYWDWKIMFMPNVIQLFIQFSIKKTYKFNLHEMLKANRKRKRNTFF